MLTSVVLYSLKIIESNSKKAHQHSIFAFFIFSNSMAFTEVFYRTLNFIEKPPFGPVGANKGLNILHVHIKFNNFFFSLEVFIGFHNITGTIITYESK